MPIYTGQRLYVCETRANAPEEGNRHIKALALDPQDFVARIHAFCGADSPTSR